MIVLVVPIMFMHCLFLNVNSLCQVLLRKRLVPKRLVFVLHRLTGLFRSCRVYMPLKPFTTLLNF